MAKSNLRWKILLCRDIWILPQVILIFQCSRCYMNKFILKSYFLTCCHKKKWCKAKHWLYSKYHLLGGEEDEKNIPAHGLFMTAPEQCWVMNYSVRKARAHCEAGLLNYLLSPVTVTTLEIWHPQTHLHTILSHGRFLQPWSTCFPATSGEVQIFCLSVISSPPRPVVHMFWREASLLGTGRIYDKNWAAVLPSGENNPPKQQSSKGRFWQ